MRDIMPTYRMINPETSIVEDIRCSIADMEVLKLDGWVMVYTPSKIISGVSTSGQGGGNKTSDEWKDTLRQIKRNNPGSNIDI
jgi:hypothetical protein|tara:strand:+ start:23 stop:271 length:249 start_codon:yes stop_codon:yes gene_type:complete